MGRYDTALICLNGHVITDSLKQNPEFATKFCRKCGAETISQCPNCNTEIRGEYHVEGVLAIGFKPETPNYCHECGKPYPWTQAKLEELRLAAMEAEGLSDEEREQLAQTVDELVKDTPRTERAVQRFKRFMQKTGKGTLGVMKSLLTDIATEYVKKQLGL